MSDSELLKYLLRKAVVFMFWAFVFVLVKIIVLARLVVRKLLQVLRVKMDERPDIYTHGRVAHGQTYLVSSTRKLYLYKSLRYSGALMVSFSVAALIYSYSSILDLSLFGRNVGASIAEASLGDGEPLTSVDGPMALPAFDVPSEMDAAERMDQVKREALGYGVDIDFSIVIPKIDAYSNVVHDVDVNAKEEYLEAMLQGVAHAKGTSYPGEPGVTYLFAHSTNSPIYIEQYNAVFYRLLELEIGNEIIVFFGGEKYDYRVVEREIVSAQNTAWVNSTDPAPRLVLQTSYPPGTIWKRLLVIAEPVR
jgi:LPXTG-site transpeptidase (sortase) family protein